MFRAIQVGSVLAALAAFGGPLVYIGSTGTFGAELIVGGTAVFLGVMFVASGAPRIYDPSRSMTVDHVERGYAHHDGESVHVERVTGSSEVRYTRRIAIRATVTGLVACTIGLALGVFM